jgi:hypothetical protein
LPLDAVEVAAVVVAVEEELVVLEVAASFPSAQC